MPMLFVFVYGYATQGQLDLGARMAAKIHDELGCRDRAGLPVFWSSGGSKSASRSRRWKGQDGQRETRGGCRVAWP